MKRSIIIIFIGFTTLVSVGPIVRAQDHALESLEASPRHHEWVEIPSGGKTLRAFVAYPEKTEKTLAVIVIHENRGLTDWVRSFADRLAGEGVIAIAPDLLSDVDAHHHQTSDFPSPDAARKAIYMLNPQQTTRYLLAAQKYILSVPSANGKIAVVGFCWGGSESFRFATHASGLSAALVFYGMAPTPREGMAEITAPVYGFYGGADGRVTSTVAETREWMEKYGKAYEPVIYEGARHAFMRDADDPDGKPANKKAGSESWVRLRSILSGIR